MSERGRFWFRASTKTAAHTLAMNFAIERSAFLRQGDLLVTSATMTQGYWGMVTVPVSEVEIVHRAIARPALIAYERVEAARGIRRDYYLAAEEEQDARRLSVEMARGLNAQQVLTSFLIWPGPIGWTVVLTVTAADHDPVRALHARVQIGQNVRFAEGEQAEQMSYTQ